MMDILVYSKYVIQFWDAESIFFSRDVRGSANSSCNSSLIYVSICEYNRQLLLLALTRHLKADNRNIQTVWEIQNRRERSSAILAT